MRNEHEAGWTPGPPTKANEDLLLRSLTLAEENVALDGGHSTLAHVIRDGRVLRILHIYGEDSAALQAQMVRLAMQIEQDDADALILVGECWSAPIDELAPYERPSENDGKVERLSVDLLQANGAAIHYYASIERQGEDARVGKWLRSSNFSNFSLTPVHIGWGHPVPEAWRALTIQLVEQAMAQRQ